MIEIRYRNQYEVADLTGRSVSDARKLFKNELGIPDKATAKLNGKRVKGNLEVETYLSECDTLAFSRPTGRGPFLIGALLLSLAITGGVFAYGATTQSTTISTIVAESDFASVSVNLSDNVSTGTWSIFGQYKGTLPDGNLFDITPAANYNGDLVALVALGNGDEMIKAYRVYVMKLEITDNASGSVTTGILSLTKGELELPIDTSANPSDYYKLRSNGGFYISHLWSGFWTPGGNEEDPLIYCDVVQR